MRPGQVTVNEFEQALLDRIGESDPRLRGKLSDLHVLSRKFTGVGSFTQFLCDADESEQKWHVSLSALVTVPDVPNGLGATLFCRGGQPDFLEVYTYGEDRWDGIYDGFEFNAG